MNVYINRLRVKYSGGMILVAANSIEEAVHVYKSSEDFYYHFEESWKMDEKDFFKLDDSEKHSNFYQDKDWKLLKGLSYDGDPCIIVEDSYVE